MDEAFTIKLKELILQNISNEQFGVSELAEAVGMSRSNLLRRIQKDHNCSASQFIRNVRLNEAMLLLKDGNKTVSEITYMVGFSSSSYFIKCFREHYGYPPGEVKKHKYNGKAKPQTQSKIKKWWWLLAAAALATGTLLLVHFSKADDEKPSEKSIAVLPFVNDSDDLSNVYVINGLMEAILNNLQSLKGLKVVSRTSVEKFRNSQLTIPEIAEELGVNYIVEGSGQKIGNQILLSVQLIQANTDDHLWAEQYNRQTDDIFKIQQEVAQKIASAVEVAITPDEQKRLDVVPTNNMVAYDLFLKALDELNNETESGLQQGVTLLRQAIDKDEQFALAHGVLSIAYYYKDKFVANKSYGDSLIYYADKALLYNPELPQGLTGKALYYIRSNDVKQAIEYLEKALDYNPNSAMVINTLSDIYTNYLPDTRKYLEYALKGISLDINSYDSITASYIYLHLSNALVQNGFVKEANTSINKSLSYNPNNLFSEYVKAYILYAQNKDLAQTEIRLKAALDKDSTRFDIMQEIGNICYYQRKWDESYKYFKKYLQIRDHLQLNSYAHKNLEIAYVCQKTGDHELANQLLKQYKAYIDVDNSDYKPLLWSSYYAYIGESEKAIEQLQLLAKEDNLQYWILLFTPIDPLNDGIKNHPEYTKTLQLITEHFWKNHNALKENLKQAKLLDALK